MADSDDHSSSGSSDDTLEPLQDEVGLPENRRQLIHRQSSSMRLHLGGSTRTSWVPDLQTGTTGKRECRAYVSGDRIRRSTRILLTNSCRLYPRRLAAAATGPCSSKIHLAATVPVSKSQTKKKRSMILARCYRSTITFPSDGKKATSIDSLRPARRPRALGNNSKNSWV